MNIDMNITLSHHHNDVIWSEFIFKELNTTPNYAWTLKHIKHLQYIKIHGYSFYKNCNIFLDKNDARVVWNYLRNIGWTPINE